MKRHAVSQPLGESYRFIPLTKGQNAVVDVEEFDRLSQWNWHSMWDECTDSFYAVRTDTQHRSIFMHKEILRIGVGQRGDHKNHDTLDNRKSNLRRSTASQNASNARKRADNASGFKGVHWAEYAQKWRSRIRFQGKRISLGVFESAQAAAKAYDTAARKYHGEFALLNFP